MSRVPLPGATHMFEETDPARSAAVHAFLSELLEDRGGGRELSLEDYQERFPGFEQAIAAAWSRTMDTDVRAETDGGTLGRYRVERLLGQGGQGHVYLVHDPRLNRRLALKVLTASFATTEDARRRFQREAETAGRVEHPGVCAIHEVGELRGMPYIAMQFVEGESLADAIARQHRAGEADRGRVEWAAHPAEASDDAADRSPSHGPVLRFSARRSHVAGAHPLLPDRAPRTRAPLLDGLDRGLGRGQRAGALHARSGRTTIP